MKKNIRHFLILSAFAAGTIHCINRFVDLTAEMKNILKSENGEYYNWKNGQIYYSKRGSGSPVLLIHDLDPVSSSYEWCRIVKKLEKTHTVYAIDLPGCGRSEKPHQIYTSYLYVQLLTDFIHDVIGESPDVVTTNRSVSFAVLAQNMDQTLMKRIIAINPPSSGSFDLTTDPHAAAKKMLLELPVIGTFIYNICMYEKNISRKLRSIYFDRPQLVSSKMLDAYYEASHMEKSHGRYLLASIAGQYTDNAITHALRNLTIPLCIIESRNLRKTVSVVDSYARYHSQVETAYISNTRLIPQLEAPDKLLSLIHMFLNDK